MTRFWFTIENSVKFVVECLKNMRGGEIFVPKIPSIKIVDLAKAMDGKKKLKIIGIRPGEKLHELMCPNESSINTLEYKKFFIIFSPDTNLDKKIREFKRTTKEIGKKVSEDFEYNSYNNNNFLSAGDIKKLNKKLKLV